MKFRSVYTPGLLLWALFTMLFFVVTFIYTHLSPLLLFLIALNLATFLLYGIDKSLAIKKRKRIPERVLWFTSFAGGPFGAVAGMHVFRHKTSKTEFQFILALVIIIELSIILLLLDPEMLLKK